MLNRKPGIMISNKPKLEFNCLSLDLGKCTNPSKTYSMVNRYSSWILEYMGRWSKGHLCLYMVDIVQDGYFLQKLSLFFQLHRLFLSTFGIEPPPSIDFSGQWCRPQSVKLILFNHINLLYSIIYWEIQQDIVSH